MALNIFETVKENVTARQVAEFYGAKVSRNGMCRCPFHNDKSPSMKVDKRFYCFGCGLQGDAIDYVAKMFGLGLKDAAVKICEDLGLEYETKNSCPTRVRKREVEKSMEQIYKETEKRCYISLCDYLHQLKQWKQEYAPKDDDDMIHPYYMEAIKETDRIEYLLDILNYGDISERAMIISDCGKEVIGIERRLERFRSAADEKAASDGRLHESRDSAR